MMLTPREPQRQKIQVAVHITYEKFDGPDEKKTQKEESDNILIS